MTASRHKPILADRPYSDFLPECDKVEDQVQRRFGRRVVRLARFSFIRGILAWWIGRDYDFVAIQDRMPGARWLIFLTAWFGGRNRRKIILLEFITCPERRLNELKYAVFLPLIYRPAMRRTLAAAQVMCPVEPEYYSKLFGLAASLFHVIPLPLLADKVEERSYRESDNVVFASARGLTDWETLFRAAEGANWNLHVACPDLDRKRVDRLNKDGLAVVQSALPWAEHLQALAAAAVYALPLAPRPVSCGQLRVRDAISAGTPIVCTRVVGLESYAIPGQTASVVEVGDHVALRREIDNLLSDPELRRTVAMRAREFAGARTPAWYARAIREFVHRVAEDPKGEAISGRLASIEQAAQRSYSLDQ